MADCNRLIPPPLKRSPARAPHIPTLYVQRKRGAAPPGQPIQPQRSVPPLRLAPSKSINHVCRPTLTVQGADGRGNPPCRARGDRLAIARSPAHDASLQSARGHARVDCHASVGKRTDGDRSHSARPGGAQSAASGRRFRPDWRFGEGSREVRAVSCVEPESCRGHYNLGIVRLNWTSWDAAIDSFRQALDIDSRYALAQLRLADAMTALAKERGSGWDDAISARTTRLLSWAWTRPKHTST